jgi:ferrous iron transport protein B
MMLDRTWTFVKEAGGIIVVCTIVLWGLLTFPRHDNIDVDSSFGDGSQVAESGGETLRQSYGGRLGQLIEPVIEPLGFDWKIGIGIIGAFSAREVFVSTMGVVYSVGGDVQPCESICAKKSETTEH